MQMSERDSYLKHFLCSRTIIQIKGQHLKIDRCVQVENAGRVQVSGILSVGESCIHDKIQPAPSGLPRRQHEPDFYSSLFASVSSMVR